MTTVEHLLTLATAYAEAAVRTDRERRAAIAADGLTDKAAALTAVRHAEATVERTRDALRAELRHVLVLPVRAVPDDELPVCTWRQGQVEVRAVTGNERRAVRVRYTPAQAVAAGAALIACAAITDQRLGGTLSTILGSFPTPEPGTGAATGGDTPERGRRA